MAAPKKQNQQNNHRATPQRRRRVRQWDRRSRRWTWLWR